MHYIVSLQIEPAERVGNLPIRSWRVAIDLGVARLGERCEQADCTHARRERKRKDQTLHDWSFPLGFAIRRRPKQARFPFGTVIRLPTLRLPSLDVDQRDGF